jgi:AraC-like DNA-binding protein
MKKIKQRIVHKISSNFIKEITPTSNLMLKMIISYSLFLLIILVLFFFLFDNNYKNMLTSYNKQQISIFQSNVTAFEQNIDVMEIFCRQLLQDTTFQRLARDKTTTARNFFADSDKVRTNLALDLYPENLLSTQDVLVYLKNTSYILTPNVFTPQKRFYSDIMFNYQPEYYEQWVETLSQPAYYYQFLSMDDYTPDFGRSLYMYIVDLSDLSYLQTHAVVIFEMDAGELEHKFACLESNPDTGFVLALSQEKNPVLSLNLPSELNPSELSNLDYADGTSSYALETSHGNVDLSIGTYVSPHTGNVYYFSYPTFDVIGRAGDYLFLYLVVFVITLLVGGILVYYFSKRNIKPIVTMGQELTQAVAVQNRLQEVVDSYQPLIRLSHIKHLMLGTVGTDEELTYVMDYLKLPREASVYHVLYMVVYNNSEGSSEAILSEQHTPEEFDRIICQSLEKYFGAPLYLYNPSERIYALLLFCEVSQKDDLFMKTQDRIVHLHEDLMKNYGIWLYAGIGLGTKSLQNLWECYQQAAEAASYMTRNYIFIPYEFIKKDSNVFYYPPEISIKLVHFITTGNEASVKELLALIYKENIKERSLPINLLNFLLSDIRNTLLKARFALPTDVSKETAAQLDKLFVQYLSFKLCEDLALNLCRIFASGKQQDQIAVIETYIQENYNDPSLCLNKISEEFQISESYFSHMFKEKVGTNFSTYLEDLRINEAYRLITETKDGLNEIYLSIGYNNPHTFRRAFKKKYGITPNKAREDILNTQSIEAR